MRDPDSYLIDRLDRIVHRCDQFEVSLRRFVNPVLNLSAQEKAAAIRKALDIGDKAILKATLKRISGE